jgi:hypothetical protein
VPGFTELKEHCCNAGNQLSLEKPRKFLSTIWTKNWQDDLLSSSKTYWKECAYWTMIYLGVSANLQSAKSSTPTLLATPMVKPPRATFDICVHKLQLGCSFSKSLMFGWSQSSPANHSLLFLSVCHLITSTRWGKQRMQHDANLHATKIRLRPWMHQNSYRLDNELASGQNHNFQKSIPIRCSSSRTTMNFLHQSKPQQNCIKLHYMVACDQPHSDQQNYIGAAKLLVSTSIPMAAWHSRETRLRRQTPWNW